MTTAKPHDGFVSLHNEFEVVWEFLDKTGGVRLKTEKKKTYFVARALTIPLEGRDGSKRAIAFVRLRAHKRGKLEKTAICLECCWRHCYACSFQRIGTYCKALDKWVSAITARDLLEQVMRKSK